MRRRLLCLGWAALTIAAGLVWRLIPLGLPAWLVKYGGSFLWAVMVYWLVAAAGARWPRLIVLTAACVTAIAVECFKLVHSPALDAFRLTLAGKLLLGRIFSVADVAVYLLAIACVAGLDARTSSPASAPRT